MSYEIGYAANEFELQQKLDAFILSTTGWSKVSQIGTFDAVYFSAGNDGFKDIYIRSRAGVTERTRRYGGTQKDFGDGYTGYLNFFAYQYFPEDGDGYDGYGEAGRYGPVMYWFTGADLNYIFVNMVGTDNGWTFINQVNDRNPPSETNDIYGWAAHLLQHSDAEFDGKRYWYFMTDNDGLHRFDMAREAIEILLTGWEGPDYMCGLQHWVDPSTRKEYVWYIKNSASSTVTIEDGRPCPTLLANELQRWNVEKGVTEQGFNGPEWNGAAFNQGDLISDGNNNLYCFRGNGYSEWSKYHIPTDTWVSLTDLPSNWYLNDGVVFLDKSDSGFNYHRIYWASANDNELYYINIDENSGSPVGSWTSAGSTPTTANRGCNIFHNFNNMFYFYPGGSGNNKKLYYAPMTSGMLSWTLNKGTDTLPTSGYPDNTTFAYVDEYQSRVKTSLYDRTQYWFVGDEDRIIVITKADEEYSFCYMGSVKQHTLITPLAITTSDVSAGSDVVVPLNIIRGEFSVGQQLFISDVTGDGYIEQTSDLENITRKFKATEVFTISGVDPGVSVTISSLNHDYPAGSKIGYDPQPIGITIDGLDKIQMLNCINTVNDAGSTDMAESMAKLQTVKEDIVNASGGDDRRGGYALWPINVVNTASDAGASGTELRGSLVGVFAVSSTGSLVSGDTVTVGTNTYMVFDVPSGAEFAYVFGPINE